MIGDSDFLDTNYEISNFKDKNGPELIHSSKNSLLFRIRKDGKYFLLKRSAIEGERGQKILRREYELSIGCDHPNIVDVYEYRKLPGNQGELIMEYVDGRTLTYFMAENPPHKTKKKVFSELLEAVACLHKRRIIHNDLKPENILISRNGDHVKLIDLGLSDDDAHCEIKTPGCSAAFAAPELKEDRKSDVRSDIYSIGMIMRELFGNRYSVISNKCLKKNPENRFKDINALKIKWKRIQNQTRNMVVIFMLIISFSAFIVLFFVNINQKKNIEKIQNELSLQSNSLTDQRQRYLTLQKTYENLKDSIKEEESKIRSHEEKKQKIINDFKTKLIKAKDVSLDSIKMGYPFEKAGNIRNNYLNYTKKLYEEQPHEIDGEDVKALMFSIYQQSIVSAFEEFNEAERVLGK